MSCSENVSARNKNTRLDKTSGSCGVADCPERKEGVFVQVASQEDDLLLMSLFTRDLNDRPIRPTGIKRVWQRGAISRFQGLFA